MKFLNLAFLAWLTLPGAKAAENFQQSISVGIGMPSISLTENVSTLEKSDDSGSEDTVATINPLAAVSLDLTYSFKQYVTKSFFLKTIIPLLSDDGSGYYMASIGMNKFFNSLSSIFSFNDEGTSLTITPTIRYYYGGQVGGAYVVYNTQTAKKTDLGLDLSAHGGAFYNLKSSLAIKAELGITRMTGVATSGFGFKVFFGGTYFLPE